LLIGIPTYNGATTIGKTLDSVIISLKALPPTIDVQILVCLDHCTDNIEGIVKDRIRKYLHDNIKIHSIENKRPQGKPGGLNETISKTESELERIWDEGKY